MDKLGVGVGGIVGVWVGFGVGVSVGSGTGVSVAGTAVVGGGVAVGAGAWVAQARVAMKTMTKDRRILRFRGIRNSFFVWGKEIICREFPEIKG